MTNFCLAFCVRLKFQSCQILSTLDLLMRPAGIFCQWTKTTVSRIHGTSFQSFEILESRTKINLILVSSKTSRWQLLRQMGVEHSVSCHCLTFSFLLWMLKNTFTAFPVSSLVFRCLCVVLSNAICL